MVNRNELVRGCFVGCTILAGGMIPMTVIPQLFAFGVARIAVSAGNASYPSTRSVMPN